MNEATDTELTTADPDSPELRHAVAVEAWLTGLERALNFWKGHPELVPVGLGLDLTEYTVAVPGAPPAEYVPTGTAMVARAKGYLADLPAPTIEVTEASVRVVDRTTFAPHHVGYHQSAEHLRPGLAEAVPDRRSGSDRRA